MRFPVYANVGISTHLSEFEIRGRLVQCDGAVDVGDEELCVVEPLCVGEDGDAPVEPEARYIEATQVPPPCKVTKYLTQFLTAVP